MSKAAKPDKSDKKAKGKPTLDGPKPRSAERDFWVFTCGVGSLFLVLATLGPR